MEEEDEEEEECIILTLMNSFKLLTSPEIKFKLFNLDFFVFL